ncbi:MAG TPA: DinB family protein [Bacteroidia bacterium]|nr:DinB family protein [Bacteroidia bacterium]
MPKQTAKQSLADVFLVNNRIDLFVLGNIPDKDLGVAHSARSRTIADQFAHLHNVRIMWLEIHKPALAKTLKKIEKGKATKKLLEESLKKSGDAMADYFRELGSPEKMAKAKKSPYNFFAYVTAHEAHHRGQILLHLKYAGVPFDRDKSYAIWEWEKM